MSARKNLQKRKIRRIRQVWANRKRLASCWTARLSPPQCDAILERLSGFYKRGWRVDDPCSVSDPMDQRLLGRLEHGGAGLTGAR